MNISGFFFQWWTRNLVGGNKNKIEWNFYLFFFLQYLKNGLKGSFTGKRVFHRGGRLQFLKKNGAWFLSVWINIKQAYLTELSASITCIHFMSYAFLVRTPVNIQFREDIIQDFLYHVFDVFYSARNISLSITD